jgi:AcrR family transcriptional regulator
MPGELANWAGSVTFQAEGLLRPTSMEELRSLVARADKVRALGSAHSFNDIADTPRALISLDGLPDTFEIDSAASTVRVGAAVRYADLGQRLNGRGYALANLASLPHISVAGSIATGTHGSGDANGNLSTAVSAIARRGFEELGYRFADAVAGTAGPRDQLRALARAYVAYALERRGMFELMFRHDLLDSEQNASDQPRLRESTLPLFERIVALVARCRDGVQEPPSAVTAAVLWSNLHGIAQLWTWRSLQLVLSQPDGARLDQLVEAVLDAHLGPANP